MSGTDVALVVVAALLVPLAGVLAGMEAALVRVSRGSSASRRPSPTRLSDSVTTTMVRPGKTASHGPCRNSG